MRKAAWSPPDVALVSLWLLAFVCFVQGKPWIAGLLAVLMCMTSFRGILMVPTLYLALLFVGPRLAETQTTSFWKKAFRNSLYFVPAGILTLAWLWHHQRIQGWLFTPPPETYGGHREVLGLGGVLRNGALIGWRFLDFGRIFPWIFLLVALVVGRKRLWSHSAFQNSFYFFLVPTLCLSLLFLPFSNPIGHRYFWICYLGLGLVILNAVHILEKKWRRSVVPALLGIGMLSGHFWIYPAQIAQGWDATLAHVHFFALHEDFMETYPEDFQTTLREKVGADFPLLSAPSIAYLRPMDRALLVSKAEIGFDNCEWILETNVSNGYSDAELASLRDAQQWDLEWERERMGVYLRLYHRR